MKVPAARLFFIGLLLIVSTGLAAAAPPASCAYKFIGTWAYAGGTTYVAPNGIAYPKCASCVPTQTWTCNGNTYLFSNSGAPGQFSGTLSPDGRTVSGGTWVSTRVGGPARAPGNVRESASGTPEKAAAKKKTAGLQEADAPKSKSKAEPKKTAAKGADKPQLIPGKTKQQCDALGGRIITYTNTAGVGPEVGECFVPAAGATPAQQLRSGSRDENCYWDERGRPCHPGSATPAVGQPGESLRDKLRRALSSGDPESDAPVASDDVAAPVARAARPVQPQGADDKQSQQSGGPSDDAWQHYMDNRNANSGDLNSGVLRAPLPGMVGLEPTPENRRAIDCFIRGSERHWKSAEDLNTIAAYRDHLARYPNCDFATLAKEKIEALQRK